MEPVAFAVDGTRMYGEWHPAVGRLRGALVLVHGLGSCVREFGDAPQRLAQRGLACLAFDLRGFGLSGGERGMIGLYHATDDLDAAVAEVKTRVPKKTPIGLVGHSLGGAYTLGFLAARDGIQAAAIAHPVDNMLEELGRLERLSYEAIGRRGQRRLRKGQPAGRIPRPPNYRHLFASKAARAQARRTPFLQGWVNVAGFGFAKGMRTQEWARHVHVPVLCIGSDDDPVVAPAHSHDVFHAIAGPTRMLRHRGRHSCFLDLDGIKIVAGIGDFFLDVLEAA